MKAMTVREVCRALDGIAPLRLAEDWDQVGLQVGDYDAKATRGLVCIDYTPAVLAEAKTKKCDFLVAYHPPMFKPLKRLTTGRSIGSGGRPGLDWKQELLVQTVREGVSVYSPHTALDAVRGGFCDMLCDVIAAGGEGYAEPIRATPVNRSEYKVVVYVPEADLSRLRDAMAKAGAGGIGKYEHCSFSSVGTGTFLPGEGANPAIGEVGRLEEVAERRLEMITPGYMLDFVIKAIHDTHPYEEPAIDVIALEPTHPDYKEAPGAGRILRLEQPITADVLASRFEDFAGAVPKLAGPRDATLSNIAVCPGAGGSFFAEVLSQDAYVTGEMQHHQVLDLVQQGKVVLLLGHTASERPLLPRYVAMIEAALPGAGGEAGGMAWLISEADVTPWAMR
ncbi:MAG: Nif3-like dinuclear metal center hexameric protein [Planctomycetota bacterium]